MVTALVGAEEKDIDEIEGQKPRKWPMDVGKCTTQQSLL